MAADYNQPANAEKRVRFFDGQYLLDQDFIDEQKYQIDRQRRHNRTLHIAGIADGLEVKQATTPKAGSVPISITAGTAVDQDGRQLVLAQDQTIDLTLSKFRNKTASVYIVFAETASDPQKAGGIESDSRWHERPEIVAEVKGQAITRDYPLLLLGELTLDGNGAITTNNAAVREYSGLRLPGPNAPAPTLRSDANGRVTLSGGLAVTGNVGIGIANPDAQVDIRKNVNGELALRIHNTRTTAAGTQTALIFGGHRDADPNLVVGKIQVRNNRGGRQDDLAHGGDMGFFTQLGTASLVERMTITRRGNVGIGTGTTAPTAKLEVIGTVKATTFDGELPADKITGTLLTDRIPTLSATKITSDQLDVGRIPNLNATKITAGTLNVDRIPNLNANKITAGTLNASRLPYIPARYVNSGTFSVARIPNLNANKITAGTINYARIPRSTSTTLAGNSDNVFPTEKAVKAYVEKRIKDVWDNYIAHKHDFGAKASGMTDSRIGNHRHNVGGVTGVPK